VAILLQISAWGTLRHPHAQINLIKPNTMTDHKQMFITNQIMIGMLRCSLKLIPLKFLFLRIRLLNPCSISSTSSSTVERMYLPRAFLLLWQDLRVIPVFIPDEFWFLFLLPYRPLKGMPLPHHPSNSSISRNKAGRCPKHHTSSFWHSRLVSFS
jgi:hypothetical protein